MSAVSLFDALCAASIFAAPIVITVAAGFVGSWLGARAERRAKA